MKLRLSEQAAKQMGLVKGEEPSADVEQSVKPEKTEQELEAERIKEEKRRLAEAYRLELKSKKTRALASDKALAAAVKQFEDEHRDGKTSLWHADRRLKDAEEAVSKLEREISELELKLGRLRQAHKDASIEMLRCRETYAEAEKIPDRLKQEVIAAWKEADEAWGGTQTAFRKKERDRKTKRAALALLEKLGYNPLDSDV